MRCIRSIFGAKVAVPKEVTNNKNFKIGDTIWFIGCGNNCSEMCLYETIIDKISKKIIDGKIIYIINDRHNMDGCHASKEECIKTYRKWLDSLMDDNL